MHPFTSLFLSRVLFSVRIYFLNFMQVQLFLSLISLPVLVAWGIPFSVMTVVGNFFFTPFLTLFLLCSSCIFFLEILNIPNFYLIYLLEKIYALWSYFLHLGSTSWLIGIDRHGVWLCTLCALLSVGVLLHKKWGTKSRSCFILFLLLVIPFLYQKVRLLFPKQTVICCNKRSVSVELKDGNMTAYDKGGLGEKKSVKTWVQYTFLTETLKKMGSISFDLVKVPYPSANTLEAVLTLCQHAPVKELCITHPHTRSAAYKQNWQTLEEYTQKNNIILTVPERKKAQKK